MIDLKALVEENRAGGAVGLPCFCTANEDVVRSILKDAAARASPP